MSQDKDVQSLVKAACVEWQSDLLAFLLGVLKDRHQAEEARQRTVMTAIQAADQVNPNTLRGWIFRIALNEARQLRRQASRTGMQSLDVSGSWESVGKAWFANGKSADSAVTGLISHELKQVVSESLEKLPRDQREVVIRRIYEGRSFQEIADFTGRPLGTILTWMRRALQKLSEDRRLREWADFESDS